MTVADPNMLAEVLHHALDGVAVVDGAAGAPRLVYVNATLAGLLRRPEESLFGRPLEEIEGDIRAVEKEIMELLREVAG